MALSRAAQQALGLAQQEKSTWTRADVALTRGTDTNTAYVFTLSPKLADPA